MKILPKILLIFIISLTAGFFLSGPVEETKYSSPQYIGYEISTLWKTYCDSKCENQVYSHKKMYSGDKDSIRLKPNISGMVDSNGVPPYKVETNRFGFRDRNYSIEKDEDTIRVLAIGDSVTFGWGVNESERFTSLLEERLNNETNSKEVEIINNGVPGLGMKEYYQLFEDHGVSLNPDVLIITVLVNDQLSKEKRSELMEEAQKSMISTENYNDLEQKEKYRIRKKEFARLRNNYLNNVSVNESSFKFTKNITDLAEKNNVEVIIYGYMKKNFHYTEYLSEFEDNNTDLVLTPKKLINSNTPPLQISKLDNHPSQKGHQILAKRLLPSLETKIKNKQ